jgi:T5SS/PEP-CTERM-associated repeat protein
MKFHVSQSCAVAACLFIIGLSPGAALAATDSWTNAFSGFWRVGPSNWSLGTPPVSGDTVFITNATTKTVTVDAATPLANRAVSLLTLSAPADAINTLVLSNVPSAFSASGVVLVTNRGALVITNSAMNASSTFDVAGGSLTLQSGSLTCAAACNLSSGDMVINGGTLTATTGASGIRCGRFAGANATLTLNGGTVRTLRLALGAATNIATTASLNINGGSLLLLSDSTEALSVGHQRGSTCSASISAGSLIATNGLSLVGTRAAATFTQTGGDVMFGDLTIGDLGAGSYNLTGGTLTLTPYQATNYFIVGRMDNGSFNQSGGLAIIRNETQIAGIANSSSPYTGAVNITGGQFIATNRLVAIGHKGDGTMTISNATVTLTNVSVGRHPGATGTLAINSNGNLYCLDALSIGRFVNSVGHVVVAGGRLSLLNDDIWVGRGGSGDLTVSDGTVRSKSLFVGVSSAETVTNYPSGLLTLAGGNTILSSNLLVGSSLLSTGQVVMAGGTLMIANASGNAYLKVDQGSFTLDQGSIVADSLYLTNLSGQFAFNGGMLAAGKVIVSNGLPFVVGDGVNPARLELQDGIFSFANGLVISPNATVIGCGTIIGLITNNGTLSTNCSRLAATKVTAVKSTPTNLTASFTTTNGQSYTLQYSADLPALRWISVPPGLVGNGSVRSLMDPNFSEARRFYRIHSP